MTVVLALSDLNFNENTFLAGKKLDIQDEEVVKHLIAIGAVEDVSELDDSVANPNEPATTPPEE